MTWSKYRRLLAVLAIPLLALGAIFFTLVVKPSLYPTIICSPGFLGDENCRNTDGLGEKRDEKLRKEHEAWFDVYTTPHKKNSFPHSIVSGSQRVVVGAQILEVSPYRGTLDSPGFPTDQLRSLIGKQMVIILGVKSGGSISPYLLRCNELSFDNDAKTYEVGLCGVPNGTVSVKFALSEHEGKKLAALRKAVDERISQARSNIIIHYAVGVPLFLVLFIFLSGIAWTIRRAITYVVGG